MPTTVTKTVKTSGGDYTTLAAWEADLGGTTSGNLVTSDEIAYCRIESSFEDTAAVVIDGWTTDATRYIDVEVIRAYRHSGKWDTSKYRLRNTSTTPLTIIENYVRVYGIQSMADPTAGGFCGILISTSITAAAAIWVVSCIGINTYVSAAASAYGITAIANHASALQYIINCIGITYSTLVHVAVATMLQNYNGASYWYNCTAGGAAAKGFRVNGGTITAKNCYAGNNTSDFNGTFFGRTYCASADATATGTGCVTGVAYSTATFVNVTAGSEDFHIVDTDSALYGAGAAPGGSAPLDYTDDIDGGTRSRWDIGADEYGVAYVPTGSPWYYFAQQ